MAGADSVIRVSIIGDAKKLIGAVGEADRATGGLVKSSAKVVGAGIVAGVGIRKGFDLVGDALTEADRLGDSMTRLEQQLGGPLADEIASTAKGFEDLGQSKGDILELSARFADIATSAGIADETIADLSPTVSGIAASMALLGDADADTVLDQIAKAAAGNAKPLKDLGVNLTDADVQARALALSGKDVGDKLTDAELAAARLSLIIEALNPKLIDARDGTSDLEQSQSELQARTETLSAELGEKLAPALNEVLGAILYTIDLIPSAVDGYSMLADGAVTSAQRIAGPFAEILQDLRDIVGLLPFVGDDNVGHVGGLIGAQGTGAGKGEDDIVRNLTNAVERNGGLHILQGGP